MTGTITQIESTPPNGDLCGISYQLTADGAGAFDTLIIPGNIWIAGIEVVFGGTTPPNALTFPLNTLDDNHKMAATTFTASGVVDLYPSVIPFPFGAKIPFTGNTTPNAKARFIVSLIRG